jgi:hypothetical protein
MTPGGIGVSEPLVTPQSIAASARSGAPPSARRTPRRAASHMVSGVVAARAPESEDPQRLPNNSSGVAPELLRASAEAEPPHVPVVINLARPLPVKYFSARVIYW